VDWNNDGKKDLIVGDTDGKVRIYLNTGTDASPVFNGFTYLQAGDADFTSYGHTAPCIVDWNNDGKKDILCGGAGGCVYLMLNTNSYASPAFGPATLVQNAGTDITFLGHPSTPLVADWNGDGKKDLLSGSSDGNVYYFENQGTDSNPTFNGYTLLAAGGTNINVGYYPRLDVVDWDGDGVKDLLVGCAGGNVWFFRDATLSQTDDTDGDGMNNAAEIHCGTDPADPKSVLRFENISTLSTDRAVLQWQSVVGKQYYIEFSTSILARAWSNLNETPLYGSTNGVACYTTTVNSARSTFFRVAVP
jgi:WD40 repeat protein